MADKLDLEALDYHRKPTPGKIAVIPTKPLANQHDLSLAYSPGVAAASLLISKDPSEASNLTSRANLVGVISNGSAVLGLGNIGALAAKAGVSIQTIRFYERKSLLAAPERTLSNYRSYSEDALKQLLFIKQCRALDMTIKEIKLVLETRANPESSCENVNTTIDKHVDDIGHRIAELKSLQETESFSKKISKIIGKGDVIFLYGEIGTGKTTFVRFLINHLEVEKKVEKSDILSPTFNIVYDYSIGELKILHYDLYRLTNYNEILELGMFETSENNIKIVEWPELIKNKPKDRIEIKFKYLKSNDARNVNIIGFGKWKEYKFDEI